MTRKKNWIKLFILLFFSLAVSILLFKLGMFDLERISVLGDDFQYNAISTSAIIGGFLFTGISILVSVIDKERIKRLWEQNYLDNLYRAAFVGMISNVLTIIIAIVLLCSNLCSQANQWLIYAEISTLVIGIVFFAWCIKQLMFVVSRLKKK